MNNDFDENAEYVFGICKSSDHSSILHLFRDDIKFKYPVVFDTLLECKQFIKRYRVEFPDTPNMSFVTLKLGEVDGNSVVAIEKKGRCICSSYKRYNDSLSIEDMKFY